MITRFKLIAAALGLVLAAGTVGEASARIIDRTIVKTTVITRAAGPVVRFAPRLHRVVVLPTHRVFRPRFVYRAPVLVRRTVVVRRAPILLPRHAMLQRAAFHRTIIR